MKILNTCLGVAACVMLMTTTTRSQTWLTNGLVAYYPLEGNLNDASGNGHHGTGVGVTLATNHLGFANSAYAFNGSGCYISASVPNLPFDNSPRTATAWVKMDSCPIAASIVSWGYGDGNLVNSMAMGSAMFVTPQLYFWNSFGDVSSGYTISTNRFYFIAFTYNGAGTVAFYADGALVGSGFTGTLRTATNNNLFKIGQSTHLLDGWSDALYGVVDTVRIYNRALSAGEISALYAFESVPEPGPSVNIHRAVYLTATNLLVGKNYQVQTSTDLVNWTNSGPVFTATNTLWQPTNFWDIENWQHLNFRVQRK